MFVIVGQDPHNAPGVLDEVRIANRLGKPILQIRPRGKRSGELHNAGPLYVWRWKTIEKAIAGLLSR